MLDEATYGVFLKVQKQLEKFENEIIHRLLSELLLDKDFTYAKEDVILELLGFKTKDGIPYSKYQQSKVIVKLCDEYVNVDVLNKHTIDYYAKKKNIKLKDLAKKVEMTERALYKTRHGISVPSAKKLERIAEVLGVPASSIRIG